MKRLLFLISLCLWAGGVAAALDPAKLKDLASDDFDVKQAAVAALAAAGDDADAQRLLKALSEDAAAVAGERLVIVAGDQVLDAATGAAIKPAPANPESINLNNSLRQQVDGALAAVRLLSTDRAERITAARALLADMGEGAPLLPLFDKALAQEQDGEIKPILIQLAAQAALGSPDVARRLQAVRELSGSGSAAVKALLLPLLDAANEPDEKVRLEAGTAIKAIDARLAWSDTAGQIFTGISLGSILLLAALGLAITYGVMGVINMAHGELIMIGAYATFVVQNLSLIHI